MGGVVVFSLILSLFFPSFAFSALARSSHSICANERIKHCMNQHPALGNQKRSADHYAVRNPHRGAAEGKANKTPNKSNTNKQGPVTPFKGRAPSKQAAYVPMN